MCKSMITPSIENLKHLQIPLHDISLATNGFADQNLIAKGGFGKVYKGVSEKHGDIAIKRLDHGQGQGDHKFKTEVALLSKYKHRNIVSLLGFCDEDGEKILVYKYESNGSLDKHLENEYLTWIQRLHICLDVARGLKHVHDNNGSHHGIFHRDVKSSNILLDANWRAKISDFGLSRVNSANMQSRFVMSNVCGTPGYIDRDYYMNGYLTEKSDVYSFGVVLWEVLCGRHALVTMYKDQRRFLPLLARNHYKKGTLDMIIHSNLLGQMKTASLLMFSNIALQCLKNAEERPTMKQVVEQLEKVVHSQMISTTSFSIVEVKPLQIPFQEILLAINGFASKNFMTTGRSGNVYEGISEKHGHIAIHWLDRGQRLGKHEFMTKVTLLSERKHEHIVSFHGFCDDNGDKILAYKYESNGSLDKHLDSKDLSWYQRLCICIDVACGLKFIHDDFDRIIHPELNSSHTFLDVDWKAKVSYLWKSRIYIPSEYAAYLC
ncbi:putative serine/threonine-protein kinase PBL28 [Bidens hawaiensis]|uniref:putative serine/threonine-protein kinase PBL28 n=1 Tax=Bidens hawaiensis TaxID=980011 RepID=UPI00404A775A